MITKRIRCSCGRVYDPVKRPACPDCGAPHLAAAPASETPNEQSEKPSALRPFPTIPKPAAIATGLVLLLLLVLALSRCGSHPQKPDPTPTPSPTATPIPASSAGASIIAPTPASSLAPPPPTGLTSDLAGALAAAAPGATIKVAPGLYPGGLVITHAVKIVGNGGVVIQGEGRECLSVRASGVSVQGVQFICNGIGELPAISVIEGADLDLDACRIQSATAVGVQLATRSALKAIGTTFTAANGAALRIKDGKAELTQSTFSESRLGLSATAGGAAELKSCAFERNGASGVGGIISLTGQGASVSANDCHFTGNTSAIFVTDGAAFTATASFFKDNGEVANTNAIFGLIAARKGGRVKIEQSRLEDNQQGLSITEGGLLEVQSCTFAGNGVAPNRQAALPTMPISVVGEGSHASIRDTSMQNSAQFAVFVLAGGNVLLDNVEIVGSHTAGLVVGEQNTAPARAAITQARFLQNGTGIGIFAGSSVALDQVECRENTDGIMIGERGSNMEMKNVKLLSNRDHGLIAYAEAKVSANNCEFRSNQRGAQVGMQRKTSGRALVSLENCAFGGNRVFGAGALAQNELSLKECTFDGTDKTNVYKERSAVVQVDATPPPAPSASPESSPEASETSDASPSPSPSATRRPRPTPSRRRRVNAPDPVRILRDIFGPG